MNVNDYIKGDYLICNGAKIGIIIKSKSIYILKIIELCEITSEYRSEKFDNVMSLVKQVFGNYVIHPLK